MGLAGIGYKLDDLPVDSNAVELVIRRVGKEYFPLGVARRTTRAHEAFGRELPVLAGDENLLCTRRTRACLDALGPAAPQISHRLPPVLHVTGDVRTVD